MIHRRSSECPREDGEDGQHARDDEPLPARRHVGLARAIENNFARELNGANPRACGEQGPQREERDKDDNDRHAEIHKL